MESSNSGGKLGSDFNIFYLDGEKIRWSKERRRDDGGLTICAKMPAEKLALRGEDEAKVFKPRMKEYLLKHLALVRHLCVTDGLGRVALREHRRPASLIT